jgi:hypothetical protein
MHKQYRKIRSYIGRASQVKSHWGLEMRSEDIFEGGLKPDRKRMYHKRANSRKISLPRMQDGKSLHGCHSRTQ